MTHSDAKLISSPSGDMAPLQPRIQALSEDLINKIAAGEVVERPASVVKELVENALDAGSTRITVTIRDGGKKLIQVSDNGCGIAPEELPLALSRHATSKIRNFDDLFHLQTKGFRGEALASIASVAQVRLASAAYGFEPHEIVVHAGETVGMREAAHGPGTTVTVKHLFYQTPARLKFLRSRETETSHIVDVVTKMALSHPQVEFSLLQDDKVLFEAPVHADEHKRVTAILGKDLEGWLYPFAGEEAGMRVSGFFGHPQVARSQRGQAYFFVNSRAVNDKVLWHAVMESYRDLLMKGKYPVILLNLHVDENTLDVNVHPAKSEIRFHHTTLVHAFVHRVLRQHLQNSPWTNRPHAFVAETPWPRPVTADNTSLPGPATTNRDSTLQTSLNEWSRRYFGDPQNHQAPGGFPERSENSAAFASSDTQTQKDIETFSAAGGTPRAVRFGGTAYAEMQPIGQWLGTYILCEAGDKLILIDQHAAHERIGFEKLLLAFGDKGIPSEPLLVPETFDLKPSETELFKNYLEEMAKFGFEIDYFGGQTFVIKALPALLKGKTDLTHLIRDLIEDIKATGELVSLKDKLHHVLATMACHAQIRAHHHLTREEMTALLRELDEYRFTDFCPHGRPVSVEITREEIERWFRRVL